MFLGSHKQLKLIYKLEKRDYYENGENFLFIKLKEKQLLEQNIFPQIRDCILRIDCYSLILTNLIRQHYNNYQFMTPSLFKNILTKIESTPNIQNTERIINCSNLLFSQTKSIETLIFIEEIEILVLRKLETKDPNEKDLFKKVNQYCN